MTKFWKITCMLELKVQFSCQQKFNIHSPVLSTNVEFLALLQISKYFDFNNFYSPTVFFFPALLMCSYITAHFGMLPD